MGLDNALLGRRRFHLECSICGEQKQRCVDKYAKVTAGNRREQKGTEWRRRVQKGAEGCERGYARRDSLFLAPKFQLGKIKAALYECLRIYEASRTSSGRHSVNRTARRASPRPPFEVIIFPPHCLFSSKYHKQRTEGINNPLADTAHW